MPRINRHLLPSDETAEICSLYVLGDLDAVDRTEFERHLQEGCPVCDDEIRRASATLQALAERSDQNAPSSLREQLEMRLNSGRLNAKWKDPSILMSESGIFIARTESMEWRAGPIPGIWVKPLFVNPKEQYSTSLVRMDAGTRYPSHRHSGTEDVFLIEGDLMVEGLSLRPGDYCNAQPPSIHRESRTEKGCLFILRACSLDEVLG